MPLIVPAVLALAAAVLAAAGVGSGQAPVVLELEVQGAPMAFGPGEAGEVVVLAHNAGRLDGRLEWTVRGAGGWQVELPAALDLPAGASRQVAVRLVAPTDPSAGTLRGEVVGTLRDPGGLAPARASVPLQAAMVVPPPPPVPQDLTPFVAGAATLLALGLGAAWWSRGGVALRVVGAPPAVRPGGETYVPVEVRNLALRSRTVHLRPARPPEGWTTGTNVSAVTLPPRGSLRAWLAVRAPADAVAGERRGVQVEAWPDGGRKCRAAVEVVVGTPPAPPPEQPLRPFAASA